MLITLASAIKYLKIKIVTSKINENRTWALFLILTWFSVGFLSISKMSMLKEVVNEVNALSALEYAAATNPKIKNKETTPY